jgi:hypothetical protein
MDLSFVNQQEVGVQLLFVFLNTVIITALLAAFALWRYRNAVLAGMQSHATAMIAPPQPPSRSRERNAQTMLSETLAWERATHRRVIATYLFSVAAGALPLAALYLVQSEMPTTPMHVVMITGIMLSAAAPMLAVSLAWSWRRGFGFAVLVLLGGAIATTAMSILQRIASGRDPSSDQLLNFFLFFAAAGVILVFPLLLLMASGSSRLRGVVPIIFAALIVFGLAPWVGYWLVFVLMQTTLGQHGLLATVGFFGVHAPFLLLAVPVGFVAWKRMHAIAASYAAKRLSDALLLSRTWWLMFVAVIAFDLILNSKRSLVVTLVGAGIAYFAFPLANRWFLARSRVARGRERPRTLLLLRTFGYRARTEKLFNRIGTRWRYFGPLSVIAAPDVFAHTIDSGDFLAWLTGRLDESFVRSQADLDRRMSQFDAAPDPDGRYRVNEFCCHDDTWKPTVVTLMVQADVIVMDLRGLTQERGGCAFELEQLRERVDAGRVVLIVDRKTPSALMAPAGEQAHGHVVLIEHDSVAETNAVFEALLKAAG